MAKDIKIAQDGGYYVGDFDYDVEVGGSKVLNVRSLTGERKSKTSDNERGGVLINHGFSSTDYPFNNVNIKAPLDISLKEIDANFASAESSIQSFLKRGLAPQEMLAGVHLGKAVLMASEANRNLTQKKAYVTTDPTSQVEMYRLDAVRFPPYIPDTKDRVASGVVTLQAKDAETLKKEINYPKYVGLTSPEDQVNMYLVCAINSMSSTVARYKKMSDIALSQEYVSEYTTKTLSFLNEALEHDYFNSKDKEIVEKKKALSEIAEMVSKIPETLNKAVDILNGKGLNAEKEKG